MTKNGEKEVLPQEIHEAYGEFHHGPMVTVNVALFEGEGTARLNNGDPISLTPGGSFLAPNGAKIRWGIQSPVSKFLLIRGDGPVV